MIRKNPLFFSRLFFSHAMKSFSLYYSNRKLVQKKSQSEKNTTVCLFFIYLLGIYNLVIIVFHANLDLFNLVDGVSNCPWKKARKEKKGFSIGDHNYVTEIIIFTLTDWRDRIFYFVIFVCVSFWRTLSIYLLTSIRLPGSKIKGLITERLKMIWIL